MQIHGKEYVEVKDRVLMAHADEGFSMLSEEVFETGGRAFVRITISCKDKQYIGTAEIKFGANPKTPDGTNPMECACTSALGRALGFANYGIVDAVCSSDEITRSQPSAPARPESSHSRLGRIKNRAMAVGWATNKQQWDERLEEIWGPGMQEENFLPEDLALIEHHMEKYALGNAPDSVAS